MLETIQATLLRQQEARIAAERTSPIWIGCMVPQEIVGHLDVPGADLHGFPHHMTLAMLSTFNPADAFDIAASVVARVARETPPLVGQTDEVARFVAVEDGSLDAIYVHFTCAGLGAWRAKLVQELTEAGLRVEDTYGFRPHITLAYVPTGADAPVASVPVMDLTFESITVDMDGARAGYKLQGNPS